jgi:undecaprenyl-diphosphatase
MDTALLLNIQEALSHPWMDQVMIFVREKSNWIPLYGLWVVILIYTQKINAWKYILATALAAGITDALNSHILKEIFERPRPCQVAEIAHQLSVLVRCSPHYSFPSSHAANHFAMAGALVFSKVWPNRFVKIALWFWAGMIALAQVYVGVHYPTDVIAGAILGIGIGYVFGKFASKIN